MYKGLKKVTLHITCFVFAMVGVNSALAFNDVPEDSWYHSYVNQLTDEGVFSNSENFRPNAPLNRAELAKILITATGGLEGFNQPNQASFNDVSSDAWFYDYVEAALQKEIMNGYSDKSGNPNGKFGPDDLVTRAAAAKTIVQAFNISIDSDAKSIFSDVGQSMWFHNYVNTAYKNSLVSGYEDGRFAPADPVTRAQIAKMVSLAQAIDQNSMPNVNEGQEAEATTQEKNADSENEKTLLITHIPLELGEQTVPRATSIPLVQYAFTAGSQDVNVAELTLTRSGVGDVTDWIGAFVYHNVLKVSSEHSFASDTNKAVIPVKMTIPAGQTSIITFYADTAVQSTPGSEHYFKIESADDIKTDAQVSGDFSPMSFKITVGNLYPNTLTVQPGSTPSRPRGPNSEVAAIKLTAGNSGDIAIKTLILTKTGSVNDDEVTDCNLYKNNDFLANTPGLYQGQAMFQLKQPYILDAGENTNFYVRCNVAITASQDTIKFYLDEAYDLVTADLDFTYYPAVPINGYTESLVPELTVR